MYSTYTQDNDPNRAWETVKIKGSYGMAPIARAQGWVVVGHLPRAPDRSPGAYEPSGGGTERRVQPGRSASQDAAVDRFEEPDRAREPSQTLDVIGPQRWQPTRAKWLEKVKIKKKKAGATAAPSGAKVRAPISQPVLAGHRSSAGPTQAPLDAKRCAEKFARPGQYVLQGKGRAGTIVDDFNTKLESYNTRLKSTIS